MTTDDFRITAFALNELPQTERLSIEAELNQSAECRREADAVFHIADLLRAEFAAEPLPDFAHEGKLAIESELARTASMPILRRQLTKFTALAAVLAACFFRSLYQLRVFAFRSGSLSYIPLIPVISLWLIWLRRTKVETDARPAWGAGGVAILSAVILAAFAWTQQPGQSSQPLVYLAWSIFAFLLFLLGVGFVCLGTKVIRSILFPVALLIFIVPLPVVARYPIESFREHSSVLLATNLFQIVGTSVESETGSWLSFRFNQGFDFSLSVGAESSCFGISSYLVLLITSLIIGNLYLRNPWNRAALTLFVIPLDILVNALRIFTVGELGVRFGLDTSLLAVYRTGGASFFALSLIPLLLLLALLRRSESRKCSPALRIL